MRKRRGYCISFDAYSYFLDCWTMVLLCYSRFCQQVYGGLRGAIRCVLKGEVKSCTDWYLDEPCYPYLAVEESWNLVGVLTNDYGSNNWKEEWYSRGEKVLLLEIKPWNLRGNKRSTALSAWQLGFSEMQLDLTWAILQVQADDKANEVKLKLANSSKLRSAWISTSRDDF